MKEYLKYLFEKPKDKNYTNWIIRIYCRIKAHSCGVWFYNVSGNTPDMRCKRCYDDLG